MRPIVLVLVLATPAIVAAQSETAVVRSAPLPPPAENVNYDYAEVLRADPIYQRVIYREPEQRCEDDVVYERVEGRRGNTGGAVLGAIIGGAIGNQIGSGSGRAAATAGGAIAGATIGSRAGTGPQDGRVVEAVRPGCRVVEVERESRELVGYEVEYRYKGEVYLSRLNHDPGSRLQVRVGITPVDEPALSETRE